MEVTHLQMIITPSITLGTKQDITDLDRRGVLANRVSIGIQSKLMIVM